MAESAKGRNSKSHPALCRGRRLRGLGLGRGLDLPVIAEGVETPAELHFLTAELCDQAQGYLLGKPEPIEVFANVTSGGLFIPRKAIAATAA